MLAAFADIHFAIMHTNVQHGPPLDWMAGVARLLCLKLECCSHTVPLQAWRPLAHVLTLLLTSCKLRGIVVHMASR